MSHGRRNKIVAAATWIFFVTVFFAVSSVFAERPKEGVGQWLQEAGVFCAYGRGDLKEQDDMEVVDLGLRLGFDLKPFVKKFGFEPKGLLEILHEPFLGAITSPRSNMELGLAMLLRYGYPLTGKLYPYIEVGSGFYYMTLSTREQSTQFNFVDQGGAGLLYFLRDDLAVSAGYRIRHISNASIKEPNSGIDSDVYTVGLSYFF